MVKKRSLLHIACSDDIRTSCRHPSSLLNRLHHRALFNTRRLNAGRVAENPADSGMRIKTFEALLSTEICKAIQRASDLDVGLGPEASENSRWPHSTLTRRPLTKHGGCDQLLVGKQ